MSDFPNVERSALYHDRYVGYAEGAVYSIRKHQGGWFAWRVSEHNTKPIALFARTLADMSHALAQCGV